VTSEEYVTKAIPNAKCIHNCKYFYITDGSDGMLAHSFIGEKQAWEDALRKLLHRMVKALTS